jgi:hypothetical protein
MAFRSGDAGGRMSALGAAVGKAVGAIGGPQVAAVVLAGGLVVGGLAGGVIVRGGGASGPGAPTTAKLSIYPCPGAGPVLATVGSGQQFLVTGRLADGSWVRIYWPLPDRSEAWIKSAPLQYQGTLDSVPVVTCAPVVAPLAIVAPSESQTPTEDNSPSPPPSSAPTSTPRNGGPSLARLAASPGTIAGGPQRYCQNTARTATFTVKATDADTVKSVVLSFREPNANAFATKPMTKVSGDTWQATLGTDVDGITGAGTIRYFVSATDANASPKSSRLPAAGFRTIDVAGCANQGPTLASLRVSPGTVHTNPGACQSSPQTATISVNATDVDQLSAVTLFYRLPGDGTFRKQAMASNGDRWSAKVTPNNQKPNADGRASFYVSATDKTGKSSKTGTSTFSVNRCNYPADFGTVNWDTNQACDSATTAFASINGAFDRDGLTGSSAKVVYSYTPKGGSRKTATRSIAQTQVIGDKHYYSGQITLKGLAAGSSISFHVTLTDKYGHTDKDLNPNEVFTITPSSTC